MTIEQLRCISEIARYGSLNKAAAALYISQPALSAVVKNLEEDLGEPIFTRKNYGVVLTPYGESILPYIRDALSCIDQIPHHLYGKTAYSKPRLSVCNGNYLYCARALAETYRAHKDDGICIDFYDVSCEESLEMVASGTAQVGGYGMYDFQKEQLMRQLETKDVQFFPLTIAGIMVSVGPQNPLFTREENWVTLDMLRKYPLLYSLTAHSTALYKKLNIFSSFNIITCSSRAGRRELYDNLDCVSISSKLSSPYQDIKFFKNRRLFQLKDVNYTTEIGYITKKNIPIPPITQEFINHIKEMFIKQDEFL
ncbi:MAG: LysR family transcriptional regulator [Lachnospiraceae bacterium]|nr:LysR family transcriptional regulator [Lachnospiraceae bacterium]